MTGPRARRGHQCEPPTEARAGDRFGCYCGARWSCLSRSTERSGAGWRLVERAGGSETADRPPEGR